MIGNQDTYLAFFQLTDDVLNIVNVKNVLLSPDATKVFYATEKLDWAKTNTLTLSI